MLNKMIGFLLTIRKEFERRKGVDRQFGVMRCVMVKEIKTDLNIEIDGKLFSSHCRNVLYLVKAVVQALGRFKYCFILRVSLFLGSLKIQGLRRK